MRCIFFILLFITGISSKSQIPLYNHLSESLPLNADSLLVDTVITVLLSSPYCKACIDELGPLLCRVASNTHKINVLYHATMSSSNYWLYFHTLKKPIPCLSDLYFSSSVYGTQPPAASKQIHVFSNKAPGLLVKCNNEYKIIDFDAIFLGEIVRPEFEELLLNMVK